jgi:protein SCO1/2
LALRGRLLLDPWEKPDFSLTDTGGDKFDFQADTEGFVTFLFFGYTYCPDICPVHMANLGAVLKRLDPQIAGKVKVVFVTTDPDRDTPERVRDWLNTFDSSFIGLLGSLDSVNAIQQRVGLPPAVIIEANETDASYTVGHAASVVAYTTDDKAHVMYPFGTRQQDWAHDIPLLVRGEW